MKPGEIWLEIPEASARAEAYSVVQISASPITLLKLHIVRDSSDIVNDSIHVKINTEAADILMTTTADANGVLGSLDLNRRGGFQLTPGRNSLEVNYLDRFKRIHYASFLIDRGFTPLTHLSASADMPVRVTDKNMRSL